jgi:hypothetical protein
MGGLHLQIQQKYPLPHPFPLPQYFHTNDMSATTTVLMSIGYSMPSTTHRPSSSILRKLSTSLLNRFIATLRVAGKRGRRMGGGGAGGGMLREGNKLGGGGGGGYIFGHVTRQHRGVHVSALIHNFPCTHLTRETTVHFLRPACGNDGAPK